MRCPHCGLDETRVVDSRPAEDGHVLRRRRACDTCGSRFTTHERSFQTALVVVKKDGRREDFFAEKLRNGISKACNKRSVATRDISALVEDVEASLRREAPVEVMSERIGELVMDRLFHLDQVAYVRFASVYQRFDDVRRFAQLLERMSRRARRQDARASSDAAPADAAATQTDETIADETVAVETVINIEAVVNDENGAEAA